MVRPSEYLAVIICFSVFIFVLAVVTLLREPIEAASAAASGFLDEPPPNTPPPPPQCAAIYAKTYKPRSSRPRVEPVTPPWVALLNRTSSSSEPVTPAPFINGSDAGGPGNSTTGPLYVHVWASQTRRLGNQLFNYASLFGIAWRNGRIPLWPDGKTQLRSVFKPRMPIDERNAIIGSPDTRFVKLREPGWAIYGPLTERLKPVNYTLTVFLQSWRYFVDVEDQLRVDLTFRDDVLDKARRFLNASTPPDWIDDADGVVRVVIHVRRGDYVTPGQQKFGWALPEPDYFNRSMRYYEDCFPRVLFVVLSNDIAWCRRNVVGPRVVYAGGRRTPTDDMAVASLCDHAIVTIGSYGWWAAWFAGGVVVTQRNFPTTRSPLLRRLSRYDYYKPEWVAI